MAGVCYPASTPGNFIQHFVLGHVGAIVNRVCAPWVGQEGGVVYTGVARNRQNNTAQIHAKDESWSL